MVPPVHSPPANEESQIIFAAACTWRKYLDPAAGGGVHQSADWWWGFSRGSLLPLEISQMSFAVFIFTPGPMVEAATQLRIY